MSTDLSHSPRTGSATAGPDHSTAAQVEAAVAAAAVAAAAVAATAPQERQRWLEALAAALEADADRLVAIADEETALGEPRLRGELAKAATNARYYGAVAAGGHWLGARVQRADDGSGLDLRRVNTPLGPVAVFGASNFPFQFGTVGHDTCSAIAAGCPVVVKAHPAHPRLAVTLAEVATSALAGVGAPTGTLGVVVGFDAGLSLVDAAAIAAIGFTGSQRGGLALVERAARREVPIPVFAEMGTVNPVVVTPAAAGRIAEVAAGFVESFTLGAGQFCTKPGLLLAPRGAQAAEAVAEQVRAHEGAWLLTAGIAEAYREGVSALQQSGGEVLAAGSAPADGYAATAAVLRVDAGDLRRGSRLVEECFGPVALVADYDTVDQALEILARMQSSLAGSVFGGGAGDADLPVVVARLAAQAGRVIVDGWPTGVACADAMHHGGPWPATSRPEATSVGAHALDRFTRPVSYQDVPDAALPLALQDANPWGLPLQPDHTESP
jgi:NADP-dependent aldehyde dehydrogenase